MLRKPLRAGFVLALLVYFVSSGLALAQSPSHAWPDVVAEIKAYAARHAKSNSPMQTQLVVDLFRGNAAGLTPQEIARIYEEEYTQVKEVTKSSPWKQLHPDIGWVVAGILMVLLIFRDLLKEWLTRFIKSAGERLYGKLAGKPFFWGEALKHYRNALLSKYEKLHISFRPSRPLDMREVYVPIKVAGSADTDQVEAYSRVTLHHRLMIKGAPGSGKSMLLKHLAMSFAEGRMYGLEAQPVPVMLELHRLNDPKATLEELLIAELGRNDFPQARRFVSNALEQGTLMLLLDGLDEVNSGERKRVVQHIKDSLDRYKKCRALITCRTAIYRGEFDEFVDEALEIVEFNDQQILRFLGSWEEDMSKRGKSIEQLMRTLHDRPRIMALARNPLLLTIIAYLYTDTEFVLPRSRAEFYRKSTDILLDLWHQEHNRFKASDKRLLLQHLALFNQDATTRQGQDRLVMDRLMVLEQVRKLLPDLNLKPESADAVLDEIVERSGLLLAIDGGERYQFAHLTLQEYFAATELVDDAKGLLERFHADHDSWRETVKLWCGLDHDSTDLIRTIKAVEPITAFECLADAQKVQPDLANEILEIFKDRLGDGGVDDAVVRAFGTVASDLRPRGEAILKSLTEFLAVSHDSTRRIAAANAMSLTNLPNAAQVLARYHAERAEFRAALVRMGELAVPELGSLLAAGRVDAMDDLLAIGTPQAAEVLVPYLWHADGNISFRAAWRLAALLPKPGVEDTIRGYQLAPEQRKASFIEWIWQPFSEPENSALPVIAGRVAFLLTRAPVELAPTIDQVLDLRLVIPLCAILRKNESGLWGMRSQLGAECLERLDSLFRGTDLSPTRLSVKNSFARFWANPKSSNINEIILLLNPSPTWRFLLGSLPPEVQGDILGRLYGLERRREGRQGNMFGRLSWPTEDDWRNVFSPVEYEFSRGWHYRVIRLVVMVLSVAAPVGAISMIARSSGIWDFETAVLLLAVLFSVGYLPLMNYNYKKEESDDFVFVVYPDIFILSSLMGVGVGVVLIYYYLRDSAWREQVGLRGIVVGLFMIGWLPATVCLVTVGVRGALSTAGILIAWGGLLGGVVALWIAGRRRERKARNPLQSIVIPQVMGVRRPGQVTVKGI